LNVTPSTSAGNPSRIGGLIDGVKSAIQRQEIDRQSELHAASAFPWVPNGAPV